LSDGSQLERVELVVQVLLKLVNVRFELLDGVCQGLILVDVFGLGFGVPLLD
jgi:hypothetical protein